MGPAPGCREVLHVGFDPVIYLISVADQLAAESCEHLPGRVRFSGLPVVVQDHRMRFTQLSAAIHPHVVLMYPVPSVFLDGDRRFIDMDDMTLKKFCLQPVGDQ